MRLTLTMTRGNLACSMEGRERRIDDTKLIIGARE